MSTTTMIHVRIDEKIKAQAAETLAAMGLSISDAVRAFLAQVVAEQQLPFASSQSNIETRRVKADSGEIVRTRRDRDRAATQLADVVGYDATTAGKKENTKNKNKRAAKSKVTVTDTEPVIYGKYLDRKILIPHGATILPKALLRRMAKKMPR